MTGPDFERIGRAINEACGKLPKGWHIEIFLERDGGSVELYDYEGNMRKYPCYHCYHERFADEIRDAVEYAVKWEEPKQ
jgi:hypothetical protein